VWCWRGGEEQKRQCIQQEKETDAFLCFEQKETKRNVFCVGGGLFQIFEFLLSL
jgi:hypothetical protein